MHSGQSIIAVARHHLEKVRKLYAQRIRDEPELIGRMVIELVADDRATIPTAKPIASFIDDGVLENAVLTDVRRWRFSPARVAGDTTEVLLVLVLDQYRPIAPAKTS